jgi:hypothetical protein
LGATLEIHAQVVEQFHGRRIQRAPLISLEGQIELALLVKRLAELSQACARIARAVGLDVGATDQFADQVQAIGCRERHARQCQPQPHVR